MIPYRPFAYAWFALLGQQVLTGEANWEDMIGADEWYGGFHRLT